MNENKNPEEELEEKTSEEVTEEVSETPAEEAAEEKTEEKAEKAPAKNKTKIPVWVYVLVGVGFAALVALIVVLILSGEPEAPAETTAAETAAESAATEAGSEAPTEAAVPAVPGFGKNEANALPDYSLKTTTPDSAEMMTVVAINQQGEEILTNGELQIYYWLEFYSFMSTYGQYAGLMGMDVNVPLNEQASPLEGYTWEQYFLKAAALHYNQNYALWQKAEAEGMTLTEEEEAEIEDLSDPQGNFAQEAKKAGFDTCDAYVQANFGDGVSVENYQHYLKTFYLATRYFSDQQKLLEADITDDTVEAYYDENAQSYEAGGLKKVHNIAVRHILIEPEHAENETPTEEALKAAEEKANEIYAQWQKDPTEENFGKLAGENTADPGSKDKGGLYDNVAPGQMVPEFDAWCFDPARKAGDSGIVKSQFGFHIMYFVGQTDTEQWREAARKDLLGGKMKEIMDGAVGEYPVQFDFTQVRVFDIVSKNAAR